MWSMLPWVPFVLLAYLCGSIPMGLCIGFSRGMDIRTQGSRNIGATNCGRVLGRPWGVLCFILDVLKGLGPVLGAGLVLGYAGRSDLGSSEAWQWLCIAAAAVLGHVFPVWLKFQGGKGVATSVGMMIAQRVHTTQSLRLNSPSSDSSLSRVSMRRRRSST